MLRGTHISAGTEHPAKGTVVLQRWELTERKQVLLVEPEKLFLHKVVWRPQTAVHSLEMTVLVSGVGLETVHKIQHEVMGFT